MDCRLGFYSHNPRRQSIPKISVIFRSCGITTFHVWERPSPPSPICPPSPSPESTAPLHRSPLSSHSSGPGPPPQQPLTPASEFACFSARRIQTLLIVRGRHYLARFLAGFQSHIKHFMIYVVLYIASCLFPKTSLYCQPYHCVATCGCMYCMFMILVIYTHYICEYTCMQLFKRIFFEIHMILITFFVSLFGAYNLGMGMVCLFVIYFSK